MVKYYRGEYSLKKKKFQTKDGYNNTKTLVEEKENTLVMRKGNGGNKIHEVLRWPLTLPLHC